MNMRLGWGIAALAILWLVVDVNVAEARGGRGGGGHSGGDGGVGGHPSRPPVRAYHPPRMSRAAAPARSNFHTRRRRPKKSSQNHTNTGPSGHANKTTDGEERQCQASPYRSDDE